MDTSLLEFIDQVESTNTYLMQQIASGRTLPQLHTVVCRQQTAGRGMRGNTWTSRPGDSLTFSFLLRSEHLLGKQQFAVSELAAWAVMRTFAYYMTDEQKTKLTVKWPNDIFYEDRKLSGILIEHSLTGQQIDYSVIGIGMNINDEAFPPELPLAVSLRMITGRNLEPMEVLIRLHTELSTLLPDFLLGRYQEVHRHYMKHLYRREGFHLFTDVDGQFRAQIKDVTAEGRLVLQREDAWERAYAFKEVRFDAE
ncbi:biotin--[acetyl-CoA-carboxylase] ligase [uncultured Porphyromonas sp.]|uniref:biotin--[acetyl-CoA-carboxylase] ligase n=1 Tax=uncultured Porphyromonas sp. TaxID=159274 RepID=UPI002630F60F|nr:biotin--[acetyl-CoA-carboxylase] ligase [uncultured Porphyromonas sp.]